jgi:hypothetical protein
MKQKKDKEREQEKEKKKTRKRLTVLPCLRGCPDRVTTNKTTLTTGCGSVIFVSRQEDH